MPRLLVTVLVLVACGPTRADEATDLVVQLFTGNARSAVAARTKLLALGPKARAALEARIDPAGASDRAPPPPAEEREEIEALIDTLDVGPFAVREQATLDLIAKGLPAMGVLRAALTGGSPERTARVTRIRAAILGAASEVGPLGSFHLVQAALVLGWLGDPAAIPSLRHLIDTGAPEVAAAADVALRMIVKGGPPVAPLAWRTGAVAARAAWRDHLAVPAGPVAEGEVVLGPPVTGVVRQVYAMSHQDLREDGAPVDDGIGEQRHYLTTMESYASTLRTADPFADDRRYDAHRATYLWLDAPDALELGADPVGLVLGEAGRLMIEPPLPPDLEGTSMLPEIEQPLFTPGLLLRSAMPVGTIRAGASIDLPAAGLARLAALLTITGAPLVGLAASGGRVHYLGRRDGIDRLHVAMEWTFVADDPGPNTVALTGVLDLDARTGEILAYDLSGPLWEPGMRYDEEPPRPALFLGEQRFSVVATDHAAFSAGTKELDAMLAALADPRLAHRIAAVQGLRAAGEAVRPALEQILHSDGDRSALSPEDALRIDRVLSAPDEGERLRAFAVMLRLGRRSARAALVAKLERATPAEVETLTPYLRWVAPPDHAVHEAALLLAAVGTDASLPALRSALAAGTPSVAAAADFALRAIVGEGPAVAANPLVPERAPLVAAWDAHLAARAAWSGAAATLAPRIAPEVELDARLRCRIALRVSDSLGRDVPNMVLTSEAEGRLRRVAGEAPRIQGRLRYRDDLDHTKPLVIENQDVDIAESAPGVFGMRIAGKSLSRTTPAVLPLSLFWHELLPAGEYAVGQVRPIERALADRFRASLVLPPTLADRLTDHAGRLRYLGRRDGRDRYALALQLVVDVAREKIEDRSALAGVVEIDPERGHIVKLTLSGPGWGRVEGRATLGWTDISEQSAPPPR